MEYKTVHPLYLARLCKSSYLDSNSTQSNRCVIRSQSHTSIVRKFNNRRIIATSGSKDFEHVWTNMDLRTVSLTDAVRFHRGFYRGAEEMWHSIESELDGDDPLLLTGHSMGGAISVALAHFVREKHPTRSVRVVTFGSPRYSTKARRLPFPIDNYVLEYDLVVKLPQYMHHLGRVRTIPTTDLPNPYRPQGIVRYHSIEHYIEKTSQVALPWTRF